MHGFFAMLSRMKYIDRWGLMRCTRNETLSEHTLETAMLVALDCLDERVKAEMRYRELNARFDEYGRVLDDVKRENDELRKLLGK